MADTRPAKLIKGELIIDQVMNYLDDPDSPWHGVPNEWRVTVQVTPQMTSYPGTRGDYTFHGMDIKAGDWIASSSGGIAVKITVIERAEPGFVNAIVTDEDSYNIYSDASGMGTGIGPTGRCVVFETAENGMPIVAPMPYGYLDPTLVTDIMNRFLLMNKLAGGSGGGSDFLKTPDDGTFSDGAFPEWKVGETTISTAIDDLSEMVNLLVPSPPPRLSTKTLAIEGSANAVGSIDILLADGVTNNDPTLTPPAAGTKISRVTNTTVSTVTVTNFNDGKTGTLVARLNGSTAGTKVLTAGDDTGQVNSLNIIKESPFPADKPGFWSALDAKITTNNVPIGVNRYELKHSTTGDATPAVFVVDDLLVTPTVSELSITPDTNPQNVTYSSGVPHYKDGANPTINFKVADLAGQTYLASNLVQVTTQPVIRSYGISPGIGGIPSVLPKNQSSINMGPLNLQPNQVIHTTAIVRVRGSNPNGDGAWLDSGTKINYMGGTPTGTIIEAGMVFVGGMIFKRVKMGPGPKPDETITAFNPAGFNSGSDISLGDAAATHEAIIRGGVLRCDQTNYTTGYLPPGPDYTGRPATQYATFIFKRITNSFTVTFTGSDPAELYVKLPSIPVMMPNATNGWWNAKVPLDFAPGRWPGDTGAGDGCLVQKTGQAYKISFGSASSANSAENIIMLRIGLTAGQAISNIQFTF